MAIKLGFIGTGSIAHAHGDAYRKMGDRIEYVACCDLNEERAKNFAEKYGFKKYYTDYKQMLAENQFDAIDVCTWNSAHAECTIAALNAGANVKCEKPMAMNTEEAIAMKEAAEKNGKLLMIGFVRRHGNDANAAIDFIQKDFLGDVYFIKASYLRRAGFPGGWFGDKSRSGGGPLIDLGVHVIDLSRYVVGNPKPVTVFGATFNKIGSRNHLKTGPKDWASSTEAEDPIFTVEDLATAMIRFDNGVVLYVEASFNLNMSNNTPGGLVFYGNKAGLTLDPFELHTECNDMLADIKIHGPTGCGDFFYYEDTNFLDAIEGKAECKAPADDGIELMRILDAIYESARTGKSVDIVR
ncbi:MAG: Gfo/Idh/MocA family oxidoreductase [Clostridia bacterium]|nr:Gfo/Idh/MocA family oxidoreductase [Clostridia bacterium]